MTTGSTGTGVFGPSRYHYAKVWGGADGRITPTPPYEEQWNQYQMASMRFRSAEPQGPYKWIYKPWNAVGQSSLSTWAESGYNPTATGYPPGAPFSESEFASYWNSNEELALLSKLIDKVKGHSFDLGVALAEVDKFAGTISGTLRNLRYGIDDLRKLRFSQFARRFGARPPSRRAQRELRTRDISGRFLEMQYAWLPSIHDAYEAAKAFEELSNGPRKIRFKQRRRIRLPKTYNNQLLEVKGILEVGRTYRLEMREELSWDASLGLTHPGNILWERLPWSFVVDWFIPIGTYLSNLGVLPTLNARWMVTDYIRWSVNGTFTESVSPDHSILPPYVSANFEVYRMQRKPLGAAPGIPFPSLKVNGAVHGKRILNAIALTHQVFSRD